MSRRLVLATRNAHKVRELRAILREVGLEVDLVGVDAFAGVPEVVEDGLTFAANALKKARSVSAATGLPALADDSGLCVDALNGMPGIFSARWAGRSGDDLANLELLLAQISDVRDDDRGAHFACAAAFVLPSGEEWVVVGRISGMIIREPRGDGGFGYDPIFVPLGGSSTLAETPSEVKNRISHRSEAFRGLAPRIREVLLVG